MAVTTRLDIVRCFGGVLPLCPKRKMVLDCFCSYINVTARDVLGCELGWVAIHFKLINFNSSPRQHGLKTLLMFLP